MINIRYYKFLEKEQVEGFFIYPIRITYANNQQRIFRVKVNKGSEVIDSKDKEKELIVKLKNLGALDFENEVEELDLQKLIPSGYNKKEGVNKGSEIQFYKFLGKEQAEGLDIYLLRITYFNGQKRVFRVKVNKGSVAIDDKDKEKKLVRKLKELGALDFESTHQEIYLQTLIMHNGEVTTKEKLEQPQNNSSNSSNGKHYAMSDIHGMYGSYMEAIRQLKDNDTLYVIGDAIDRGKNGIKILKDIISRQHGGKKPRVVFLLGNHENQMIDVLSAIRQYRLSKNQIEQMRLAGEDLVRVDNFQKFYNETADVQERTSYTQKIQELQMDARGKLNQIPERLKNDEDKVKLFYRWLTTNVGEKTLEEYLQLSQKEQDEIYEFLTDKAFVQITKKIQNKKYCLVHATPLNIPSWMDMFNKNESTGITLSAMDKMMGTTSKKVIRDCLGIRKSKNEKAWTTAFRLWKENGFFTIYGHTPVREVKGIQKDVGNGCICIDSGCSQAKNDKYFAYGKLALYCIDDEMIQYIEPREEEKGTVQGGSGGR